MDKPSQLRALLEDAVAMLSNGEAAEAERHAKAISAIVRAERDVAEQTSAQTASSEQDEEQLRDELRRRIARFAADHGAGFPAPIAERLGIEKVQG